MKIAFLLVEQILMLISKNRHHRSVQSGSQSHFGIIFCVNLRYRNLISPNSLKSQFWKKWTRRLSREATKICNRLKIVDILISLMKTVKTKTVNELAIIRNPIKCDE